MVDSTPEKARLLQLLRQKRFKVPDFLYVPAADFKRQNFADLDAFLKDHQQDFKVIARSAHPLEHFFKGGTFDSVETYADSAGIQWARKRIINLAQTAKRLSIRRQQHFNNAPQVDLEEMGIIVMPFIYGSSVMAKKLWDHWEFGYCRDRVHKVQSEPYVTSTPHDLKLLKVSEDIQACLDFPCEIEFVITEDGQIHVVQAKDISKIDILEHKDSARSLRLDRVHRIRKRRNYRERPLFVMDNKSFFLSVIAMCEEIVSGGVEGASGLKSILNCIERYENELEAFALKHQRFAILGLSIREPEDLFQIANHYLDDMPELQAELSKALHRNLYKIDTFMAEADTLIAKDKFRVNLCSHDAYGIDTVRNPIWSVTWLAEHHEEVFKKLEAIGFKTGDSIGIDIDKDGIPTLLRI